MNNCEVKIKSPIKGFLEFDLACAEANLKFMICDSHRLILLSGKLQARSPHRIDVLTLNPGSYNLKIVDGKVWGDNPFEIK